jgi:hypothetical protein
MPGLGSGLVSELPTNHLGIVGFFSDVLRDYN